MNEEILDHGITNLTPGDDAKARRLLYENKEHRKRIRNGRILLGILAALTIVSILVTVNRYQNTIFAEQILRNVYIQGGIIFFGFIGALFYSFSNPKEAFILGLVLYIGNHLYAFYLGATISIFAIFLKVIIVIWFIATIRASMLKEKNDKFISSLGLDPTIK